MKKCENGKVEMVGLTDKHVQILYQTLADILAKKIAPNVKVTVKIKKKMGKTIDYFSEKELKKTGVI